VVLWACYTWKTVQHSSALEKLKQVPKQWFDLSSKNSVINGKNSLSGSEDGRQWICGNDTVGTPSSYGVVNFLEFSAELSHSLTVSFQD